MSVNKLGENGQIGESALTPEQVLAKRRLKKDIAQIKKAAENVGKSVTEYMTDLGYDKKIIPYLARKAEELKTEAPVREFVKSEKPGAIPGEKKKKGFLKKGGVKKYSKIIDVICFVIGPFITVLSIFSFSPSHRGLGGSRGGYYSDESKIGIGIGVALICIGILRKHWRKDTINQDKIEQENK